jgi:hypothetical protein
MGTTFAFFVAVFFFGAAAFLGVAAFVAAAGVAAEAVARGFLAVLGFFTVSAMELPPLDGSINEPLFSSVLNCHAKMKTEAHARTYPVNARLL